MKNKLFRSYFFLMLGLMVYVSFQSRGLTLESSNDSGSILRKPEERFPIEPNESGKGKKIIKRVYKSRNLC